MQCEAIASRSGLRCPHKHVAKTRCGHSVCGRHKNWDARGGSFFDTLKKIGSKAVELGKAALPYAKAALPYVKEALPLVGPHGVAAAKALDYFVPSKSKSRRQVVADNADAVQQAVRAPIDSQPPFRPVTHNYLRSTPRRAPARRKAAVVASGAYRAAAAKRKPRARRPAKIRAVLNKRAARKAR